MKNLKISTETNQEPISPESLPFDESFKQLESVAASLSNSLDNTSEQIRKLEKRLIELKTNFPFEMIVCKEELSQARPLGDHHLPLQFLADVYCTQIFWFLSWDPDNISKTYRLFLRCQKEELGYNTSTKKEVRLKASVLFKKPLLDTKLEVRLKYSKYLIPFMNFFTKALVDYKTAIQNQDVFTPDIISCNNPLGVTSLSDSAGEGSELVKAAVNEVQPLKNEVPFETEIFLEMQKIKNKHRKSSNA